MKLQVLVVGLSAFLSAGDVFSEDKPQAQGLLPIPEYSDDILTSSYLSGDWGGTRQELAESGIQFSVDWTQTLQKVTSGGLERNTGYGNTFDYDMTVDLMRMGVLPGALIKFRAETRLGDSINGTAGNLLPANTDMLFPLGDSLDEDIGFVITNLSYTQFLSEKFAISLGKLDTLDGDPNEFASGRGMTQFMGANFLFNSATALRLPYSTLGVGVLYMPIPPAADGGLTISSALLSTTDSSKTSGFDTLGDGATWTVEADSQYRLAGLPGGQNLGFLYSFDQDFREIGGRLIFQPGEGLILPQDDETWAVYWSAWQYLYTKDAVNGPIDLANRKVDHEGIGLFARAGVADQDTNPVEGSFSLGLGGRGVFTRAQDSYGLGYYYTKLQSGLFTNAVGIDDHAQGFEGFYNFAITPAVNLSIDAQSVESMLSRLDTTFIVGGRLKVTL